MTTDPTAYIFAAAVLGVASGATIAACYYRARMRRQYKATWNGARLFYTRLYAEHRDR